ncbi:hypothetical protein [Cerasicoccus maritimus]|uniref:hypothetical protein n=1 Tax=Cerasicoccus maritimus TaxID=490089 RepID=UPI002852D751|nr:hypothetical protein [Cerasicoccus maritimus]
MPYVESSSSGKQRKRRSSSSRARSSSRSSSNKKSSSSRARSKVKIREAKAPQFSLYSSLLNRITVGSKPEPLSAKETILLYIAGFTCLIVISLVVLAWNSRSAPMLEWTDETQLPVMSDSAMGVSSAVAPEGEAYIEPFLCRGHA